MRRRDFLQQAGLGLAALGLTETGLAIQAERYYQALAKPTARKLALLVGINQYSQQVYDPRGSLNPNLKGCVTDVDLQRELLIHRFGFRDRDILVLTDQQATRQNIETAFVDHLINQAQAEDVVLFHFSGYGSDVQLEGLETDAHQSSLVPVNGEMPTTQDAVVQDLPESTLWLLLQCLATQAVTTVLDASYIPPQQAVQGNLQIRSRLSSVMGRLSEAELAFREQLHQRLTPNAQEITGSLPEIPGLLLTAAGPTQLTTRVPDATTPGEKAFEVQWQGFSAGLFTYALTQSLWGATPVTKVYTVFSRAVARVGQVVGQEQQPQGFGVWTGAAPESAQQAATYYLPPQLAQGSDGVIIDVEGETLTLWLAGLPDQVVNYYGSNSIFQVLPGVSSTSNEIAQQLQLQSREGLRAQAQRCCGDGIGALLRIGDQVQEVLRVLPREVKLLVALDASLDRIERIDAASAFSGLPWVWLSNVGEQPADYIFGRIQEEGYSYMNHNYGLFSPCRTLVPNTLGQGGEAVKTAVGRLVSPLRTLLAAKLLQLTVNDGSSQLGFRVTIELTAPQRQILMHRETTRVRSLTSSAIPATQSLEVLSVPMGSRIRYLLENHSDRPAHVILVGLDSNGSMIALYTEESRNMQGPPSLVDEVIEVGQGGTIPRRTASFEWEVNGPPGVAQVYLIASPSPFTHTLQALAKSVRPIERSQRINSPDNPLAVAHGVLQDLHDASVQMVPERDMIPEDYALALGAWATLGFVYQVV